MDKKEQKNISSNLKANEKTPGVKKNFLLNLLISVSTYLVSLITAPYLSRVLTPTGIGDYSFANSVVSYFGLFITLGFTDYGTRFLAIKSKKKEDFSSGFWNILYCKTFLSVFVFLVYFIVIYYGGFRQRIDDKTMYLFSFVLLSNYLDLTYVFQAKGMFRELSYINLLWKAIYVIFVFAFVKSQSDFYTYVLISSAYLVLISISQWALLFRKKIISKPSFDRKSFWHTLGYGFLYFLPTIAISIYTMADKTMIGLLANNEQVGYYEQAYKVVYTVVALLFALGPVIMPTMAVLYQTHNYKEINQKIEKASSLYSLIAFPSFCGLYLIAQYFIPAFFGNDYIPSISVIYYMIPIVLFMPAIYYLGNSVIIPQNKIVLSTIFSFIGAITNITLNFFCITAMGASGAALTSSITEFVILVCYIIGCRKYVNYITILKTFIKPFISSIIMSGILVLLNYFWLNNQDYGNIINSIIIFCFGVFSYSISLILLREKNVLILIKKVFKKRKNNG